MKASYWLAFGLGVTLLGATACGADPKKVTTPGLDEDDGETDGQDEGDPSADVDAGSGPKKDAGKKDGGKDAGKDAGKKDTGGDPNACQNISLPSDPLAPQILIVLDRSASMIGLDPASLGKDRWTPSVSAIKALTSELDKTVAFGLMLFPTPQMGGIIGGVLGTPTGASCAPGKIDVEVSGGTADDIAVVLDRSGPDVGFTPTAASLMAAKDALDVACVDCREVPKYVLLVTDGQPTCVGMGGTSTTPADVDATNAAIDALRESDIKTFVIGYDTASDPMTAATMDGFADHGGTGKHLPVEDETTLLSELKKIAGALIPCEFELDDVVEDPSFVRVEIDGVTYKYGQDWTLVDGNKVVLSNEGNACPTLRDADVHLLDITRECEPISIM